MPFVTNNSANPIAFGSVVIPIAGTAEFNAADWNRHSEPEHVKGFVENGVISVQDKAPKGAEVAEAVEPETPAADAAPQGRRAVRG